MQRIPFILLIIFAISSCSNKTERIKNEFEFISVKEYQDAVYASWIGQIIGNTYGLGYEFKYIDQPGPDSFPYGYSFTLNDLVKYNGAYSDDDTDIEYMYLIQMEKYGIEPTYYQLAEAWKKHVKERVWFANRMAVTLMHAGHYPPITGMKTYNCEWFQIDPQLVNEIWAITAPGMIDYAVKKSEFAARITSDSFGLEPTLHYAAMYSAAFFEKDINKLIDIGTSKIPDHSKFKITVKHIKELYAKHPNNWQKAREEVKKAYYVNEDYNKHSWAAVDANLNGALGILALLYGQGDFQKTLDYSCAFGMDADNQAATMCGLLGIVNGLDSIPKELVFPIDSLHWKEPFNDSYRMITREGLSDVKISELANRTAKQGEKIILSNGGELTSKNGESYYKISSNTSFIPPFELNPVPVFFVELNNYFEYPIYKVENSKLKIEGKLPPGIRLKNSKLLGKPEESGEYEITLKAICNNKTHSQSIEFKVYSMNLANSAKNIISNTCKNISDLEIIRDGDVKATFKTKLNIENKGTDFYGYIWDKEQTISAMSYNPGKPEEFCGWFTSFKVQYLNDGNWVDVQGINIEPPLNMENTQWLKPAFINYNISFAAIKTKGIRIVGYRGGIKKDAANAHLGIEYKSTISELRVY